MKVNNYIDDTFYVIANSYFIVCYVLSSLIVILNAKTSYFIIGIICLFLITIIVYFFYFRRYEFLKNKMVIKIGFIKKEYFYKDMKKCYITKNRKRSFATSYKRLCICLKDKNIYISPKKMDEVLLFLINKMGGKK